jgi:hypothetical protein
MCSCVHNKISPVLFCRWCPRSKDLISHDALVRTMDFWVTAAGTHMHGCAEHVSCQSCCRIRSRRKLLFFLSLSRTREVTCRWQRIRVYELILFEDDHQVHRLVLNGIKIGWQLIANLVRLDCWMNWQGCNPGAAVGSRKTCWSYRWKKWRIPLEWQNPVVAIPTIGVNWRGLNSANVLDEELRIRRRATTRDSGIEISTRRTQIHVPAVEDRYILLAI